MFGFFWTRSASPGLAVVYMALGLTVLLYPEMTGAAFCWALAAGAAAFAAARLFRWRQAARRGERAAGEAVLAAVFAALAVFCVLGSRVVLSIVPVVSGVLLLADGVGKLPLVMDAKRTNAPVMLPLLASAAVPLVLGVVLIANPFGAARLVIRFFGFSLLLDGACDLAAALRARPGP